MEHKLEMKKTDSGESKDKARPLKPKRKKGKLKKRIITVLVILVAVAAALVIIQRYRMKNEKAELMNMELVAAERRDIKNTVTGSSVIEPKDSYSVTARITGEILEDTFNEGDVVKKGDVLYRVDDEAAQKSVTSAENSLQKAQRNYDDIAEDIKKLTVKSDTAGKISEILVKEGESINSGTKIANVYSDTCMELSLPFNEGDASSISQGDYASVTVVGTGDEIWGTVTHISTATSSTSSHAIVRYVTIEVKNPGALTINDSGTAIVNDVACAAAANFEYTSEGTILSDVAGTVSKIYIKQQDKVTNGQIVAELTSEDMNSKLNDAKIDVEEAQMNLDKAKDTLEDYTITAPIDGTIVTKNKKAGDNMMNNASATDSSSMAEIYDLSSLKFQLSVDETEVDKIKVGQSVSVTADAVEGEFSGTVTKVGIDGTSSNGVTTYPVDVEIKEYGELLPGMNITAEIVVEEAIDVLAIPISAVQRGSIVYIKDDGKDAQSDDENNEENKPQGGIPQGDSGQAPEGRMSQGERGQMTPKEESQERNNEDEGQPREVPQEKSDGDMPPGARMDAPEGYKAVVVELGINDLEYIEVISGLEEGQEVLVQSVASAENSGEEQQMMPGMGGMGGGMPGGNMGGGMPGGNMGGGMPGGMR